MSDTNEDIGSIQEKLDYIGLDLENIPNIFKEYNRLEYRPARGYEENKYKVYRYLDIKDIQILITPTNRLDSLADKCSKASNLYEYLEPKKEEDILKHAVFFNMLNTVSIGEIEKIEEQQKLLKEGIPFKVKYYENYLWQIYYSEISNKYFMLVPTVDSEYASFFYLLKQQIECYKNNKEEKIFVPICHVDYSGEYLRKSEISDIENYLWLFTKEWPLIYEVYDKYNNLSIHIVGETIVYEKFRSYYKIVLENKEKSIKFFKLLKALFILQTELHEYYKFVPKIDESGGLEFYFDSQKIEYEDLTELVEREYINAKEKMSNIINENKILDNELEILQHKEKKLELEYIEKEKEISTYLECRKSFFGRVKYFFKSKKRREIKNEDEAIEVKDSEKVGESKEEQIENKDIRKSFYTIEDLIKIIKELNKIESHKKKNILDIEALKNKVKTMEYKVENAKQYIEEIEEHNKSIFDFWKYTNKDESLKLNSGEAIEDEVNKIKLEKTFDYIEDIEELGIKVDRVQKNQLTKSETDAIFITNTEIINILNIMKKYKEYEPLKCEDEDKIKYSLERLKKEAEKSKTFFSKEDFDIFGGISEDRTKIKNLLGKKHREIEKNKFKILDITRNTDTQDYKEIIKNILNVIYSAMEKIKVPINMSVYISENKEIDKNEFKIFHINPEKAINKGKFDTNVNLYRFNLKEGMPAIFFSNIIYYDNYNQTLPVGMDLSEEVLIDISKFNLELKQSSIFRINTDIDELYSEVKEINLYEYNLNEKERNKNNDKQSDYNGIR